MSHFIDIEANRRALQRALAAAGYPCGKIDGVLGDKSAAAIARYRADHKLLPAGAIADAALIHSLNLDSAPTTGGTPGMSISAQVIGIAINLITNGKVSKIMDIGKISKAIAAAIAAATSTGAATAGIYITLPPNAQDYLPAWVPVTVTAVNTALAAGWAFWITYSAPANKPA